MNNKNIDLISLSVCKSLLKDQSGKIIYPGDILIKNNEYLEFANKKFNNTSIEDLILDNEYEEMITYIMTR